MFVSLLDPVFISFAYNQKWNCLITVCLGGLLTLIQCNVLLASWISKFNSFHSFGKFTNISLNKHSSLFMLHMSFWYTNFIIFILLIKSSNSGRFSSLFQNLFLPLFWVICTLVSSSYLLSLLQVCLFTDALYCIIIIIVYILYVQNFYLRPFHNSIFFGEKPDVH